MVSLVSFDTACPIFLHLIGGGNFERPHDAKADELGVSEEPSAFGQLRVLHFP